MLEVCTTTAMLHDKGLSVVTECVTCDLDSGANFINDGITTCAASLISIEEWCKEHTKAVCYKVEEVWALTCNTCCYVKDYSDWPVKDGEAGEDDAYCVEKYSEDAMYKYAVYADETSKYKEVESSEARCCD